MSGGYKHNATGRTKTQHLRSRHRKIEGQFVPYRQEMLESPAFRELSLSAHRVLARIAIEHMQHGGFENGRLPVTFDQFEEYGITDRHSIAPAIRELAALGFIEKTVQGSGGDAKREHRAPNCFRLTYIATDTEGPTNEWRQIKTAAEAKLIAMAARKSLPGKREQRGPERRDPRPNTTGAERRT